MGGQARGIVTGKALVTGQGIGIHLNAVAHGLQAAHPAPKRGLVANHPRRGIHINMPCARGVVVGAVTRLGVVVGMRMVMAMLGIVGRMVRRHGRGQAQRPLKN